MEEALLVGVRLALYASLGLLFGLPLFALYGVLPADRHRLALRARLIGLAAVGLLGSALAVPLLAATMSGLGAADVDRQIIAALLAMPGVGVPLAARGTALVALVVAAVLVRSDRSLAVAGAALGAVALGSLAWTGHGAAFTGWPGTLHLIADVAHLLAAGAWLGAILSLLLLLRPGAADSRRGEIALSGFASAGSLLVAIVVATGAINGWSLVGLDGVATLPSSPYGRLLILKLLLFAAMLGAAALNRFWLVPHVMARRLGADGPRDGRRAMTRMLASELALGVCILAIVGWMGRLEPPAVS